ncbi:MAG TPA: DUF1801 domain-containing protein [Candidatus Dojkabacteria bacterium]|nr:DUF1801 domain-containing protein [Candidatus Dojkabacteria bacterium]
MNMFKTTSAKSPEDYIAMLDEPRKSEIQRLHDFIKKTLPDRKPFIISGMIGYGPVHLKYKSGREVDWSLIALASQKNYISLYVYATKKGQYIAETYKDRLPKTSIGKSCIRFKNIENIDLKVIEKVLKEADIYGFNLI